MIVQKVRDALGTSVVWDVVCGEPCPREHGRRCAQTWAESGAISALFRSGDPRREGDELVPYALSRLRLVHDIVFRLTAACDTSIQIFNLADVAVRPRLSNAREDVLREVGAAARSRK